MNAIISKYHKNFIDGDEDNQVDGFDCRANVGDLNDAKTHICVEKYDTAPAHRASCGRTSWTKWEVITPELVTKKTANGDVTYNAPNFPSFFGISSYRSKL